jgi:hypothetical protein
MATMLESDVPLAREGIVARGSLEWAAALLEEAKMLQ